MAQDLHHGLLDHDADLGPLELPLFEDAAHVDRLFDAARTRANEGLVVKDPSSIYTPGRRGKSWLKYKKILATLDCVVTLAQWGNGKRRALLSDLTFAVTEGFVAEVSRDRLPDLVRYLQGIERRLDKLPNDPVRDGLSMRRVATVQAEYEKNRPFALDLAKSAADPADPARGTPEELQ